MIKEEYIGTIELNNTKIDIGIDDYGQQYFFEFIVNCRRFLLNFNKFFIFLRRQRALFEFPNRQSFSRKKHF